MNDVEFCDASGLANFQWPSGTEYERALLTPLIQHGVRPYFANIDTNMLLVRLGKIVFPVTINDREYENSYVCSPYTATISYPREELAKLDTDIERHERRLANGQCKRLTRHHYGQIRSRSPLDRCAGDEREAVVRKVCFIYSAIHIQIEA